MSLSQAEEGACFYFGPQDTIGEIIWQKFCFERLAKKRNELRRFGRNLGRRGNGPGGRDCCDAVHHANHCEGESERNVLGDGAHSDARRKLQ